MPVESKFGALPARRKQGPTAFLTVQEGCDKFCTYCVVPYTRGAEVSRSWGMIIDEAKALVDRGARVITLLGQNVNAWSGGAANSASPGMDGPAPALDRMPGRDRLGLTTPPTTVMTVRQHRATSEIVTVMVSTHNP